MLLNLRNVVNVDEIARGYHRDGLRLLVDGERVCGKLVHHLFLVDIRVVVLLVAWVVQDLEDRHVGVVDHTRALHGGDLVVRDALRDSVVLLLVVGGDFPLGARDEVEKLVALPVAHSNDVTLLTRVVGSVHALLPIRNLIKGCKNLWSGQVLLNGLWSCLDFLYNERLRLL